MVKVGFVLFGFALAGILLVLTGIANVGPCTLDKPGTVVIFLFLGGGVGMVLLLAAFSRACWRSVKEMRLRGRANPRLSKS
jgi:hypothetical protein